MKPRLFALTVLFAAAAAVSATVAAADARPADASPGERGGVPDKTQATPKPSPHSHMQERSGMSATLPDVTAKPGKPLHDHQKFHKNA